MSYQIGFHKVVYDDSGRKCGSSPWPSFFDVQEYDNIESAMKALPERVADQDLETKRRYVPTVWNTDEIGKY